MYHWTHLELKRYFDISELVNTHTAEAIYHEAGTQLAHPEFSCRNILRRMNVEVVCTTDDPVDSLEHHIALKKDFEVRVLPTFRPDKAYAVENETAYANYVEALSEVTGTAVNSFDTLMAALEKRISFFHENGCRLSDHGLERLYHEKVSADEVRKIFLKVLGGHALSTEEIQKFKYAVLV